MPKYIFLKDIALTHNKVYDIRLSDQLFKQLLISYDIYRNAPPLWLRIVNSLIVSQRFNAP